MAPLSRFPASTVLGDTAMNAVQAQLSLLAAIIRSAVLHPAVRVAAALWIVTNVAVVLMAGGVLPFDRPALADMPFVQQVALPSLGLIEVFALMAVVYVLTNRTNDLLVIVIVAVIESLVELGAFPGIFQLSTRQLLIAAPLAFGVFMIGTVLPTMVLIYAILIPRYLKLTGSSATTVILGGLTYAAMHIVEGWSVFTTPRDIALSLIFVVLQYWWSIPLR
jgi:hypothetical protein